MGNKLAEGPWCGVLERLTRDMADQTARSARVLLTAVCARPEDLTSEKRVAAGLAARRLLEFAWTREVRDGILVEFSLEAVCRTYESDIAASSALLRRALAPDHLAQHGYKEIPRLADEVDRLVPVHPEFVAEVYICAFTHDEDSKEKTDMGASRILSLTSTRKQDYGLAHHRLLEAFPAFLSQAPKQATEAIIGILEAYVPRKHHYGFDASREKKTLVGGQEIRLLGDYSQSWDGSTYQSVHDELKMLNMFQERLEVLAADASRQEELAAILSVIREKNRLAVLWRRIFKIGIKFPATLGKALLPIAQSTLFMLDDETSALSVKILGTLYPGLSKADKELIEKNILEIPAGYSPEKRSRGEEERDALLSLLPSTEVVSEEAKLRIQTIGPTAPADEDEDDDAEGGWTAREMSDVEDLAEEGVPVESEPNRAIRVLYKPAAEFASKHLNSVPAREEALKLLAPLKSLRAALSTAEKDGVHPKQQDQAWTHLAAAAEVFAKIEEITSEDELLAFTQEVLLVASASPVLIRDSESEENFDEHQHWSGGNPRIRAAEGLMYLARRPDRTTPEMLMAIGRLAVDPVPAVRFQVARFLNTLFNSAPELMWALAAQFSKDETSRGVLKALLSGPMGKFASADEARGFSMLKQILERTTGDTDTGESVRRKCARLLIQLNLWRGNVASGEIVHGFAANPLEHVDICQSMLLDLRDLLVHGPVDPSDPIMDARRARALEMLQLILDSGLAAVKTVEGRQTGKPFVDWPAEEKDLIKDLYRLVDSCGDQIYFGSGAYAKRNARDGGRHDVQVPEDAMKRFYREATPTIERLAQSGLASVTHHLLETLEVFIPFDPAGVFVLIGQVTAAGARGGYQFESLGAGLLVRIVERYLAEHRALFREDERCRKALVAALDLFVQAGWPSARSLTFKLNDIYR